MENLCTPSAIQTQMNLISYFWADWSVVAVLKTTAILLNYPTLSFFHIFLRKTNTKFEFLSILGIAHKSEKIVNFGLKVYFLGQNRLKHMELILCARASAYFL